MRYLDDASIMSRWVATLSVCFVVSCASRGQISTEDINHTVSRISIGSNRVEVLSILANGGFACGLVDTFRVEAADNGIIVYDDPVFQDGSRLVVKESEQYSVLVGADELYLCNKYVARGISTTQVIEVKVFFDGHSTLTGVIR